MYKAIKEIGGYKIGQEVPIELAKAWLIMYDVPHVELSSESVPKKTEASKPVVNKPAINKQAVKN